MINLIIQMKNSSQLFTYFQSNKREPTLFLVCGDHGMKDSGGHGGATLEETLVPLLAFGKPCTNKQSPNQEIAQIDIAPTLSVLLGTPIPSTNLGTVILELMSDFSLSHKLFALYYNAEQLFLHYQKVSGHQYTSECERLNFTNKVVAQRAKFFFSLQKLIRATRMP